MKFTRGIEDQKENNRMDLIQNLPVMHPEFQKKIQEYVKEKQLINEEDAIIPKILSEFPGYSGMFRFWSLFFMFLFTTSFSRFSHPVWLALFIVLEILYY